MHGDGIVVGVAVFVDLFAHAAERDGCGVASGADRARHFGDDLDRVRFGAQRCAGGEHVLVDEELVQDVGLVVEVEGTGRAGVGAGWSSVPSSGHMRLNRRRRVVELRTFLRCRLLRACWVSEGSKGSS